MSDYQATTKLVMITVQQHHFVEVASTLSDSEAIEAAKQGAPTESFPPKVILEKVVNRGDGEEGDRDDD